MTRSTKCGHGVWQHASCSPAAIELSDSTGEHTEGIREEAVTGNRKVGEVRMCERELGGRRGTRPPRSVDTTGGSLTEVPF